MKYWRLLASFVLAMRTVARLFSIMQEWLLVAASDFQSPGISSKSGCSQPMTLNHIAQHWLD